MANQFGRTVTIIDTEESIVAASNVETALRELIVHVFDELAVQRQVFSLATTTKTEPLILDQPNQLTTAQNDAIDQRVSALINARISNLEAQTKLQVSK